MSTSEEEAVIVTPGVPITLPVPRIVGEMFVVYDVDGSTMALFTAEPVWKIVSEVTRARKQVGLRWERVQWLGGPGGDQA
jgi:hypothetical protein